MYTIKFTGKTPIAGFNIKKMSISMPLDNGELFCDQNLRVTYTGTESSPTVEGCTIAPHNILYFECESPHREWLDYFTEMNDAYEIQPQPHKNQKFLYINAEITPIADATTLFLVDKYKYSLCGEIKNACMELQRVDSWTGCTEEQSNLVVFKIIVDTSSLAELCILQEEVENPYEPGSFEHNFFKRLQATPVDTHNSNKEL